MLASLTEELTLFVRAVTASSHGSAQSSFSNVRMVVGEQSRGRAPSTSLAALSSCLLCVKRMLVVVLIVRLLSRELTKVTSRSSSCCFGFVISSKGTRGEAGVEVVVVLARLLLPADSQSMTTHNCAGTHNTHTLHTYLHKDGHTFCCFMGAKCLVVCLH